MKRYGMILVMSAGAVLTARADDWPQFRGPARDGISQETGWFKTGVTAKVVWEAQVGAGYSGPAIKDGRFYTMGHQQGSDTVYCFGAATGKKLWDYAYACESGSYAGPRCTPTIDGTHVLVVSRKGQLLCLDAIKGGLVWQRDLAKEMGLKVPGWGISGSPLVVGDLVVVNAGARGLAVDKTTGATKWDSGVDGTGYASPVLRTLPGGRTELVVFAAKGVVGVEPTTGKRLWEHPWSTSYDVNAADPLVWGEKVLISSGYGRGATLLTVAGDQPKVEWENKNLASHFSSPVMAGGFLYGVSGNTGKGDVRCLDVASGTTKWTSKEAGFGSLMLAGGKLIVLSEKGRLMVAEAVPDAWHELWGQQVLDGVCWTMPVLSRGLIYCRNDKGHVVCLDLKGK